MRYNCVCVLDPEDSLEQNTIFWGMMQIGINS
jgi:hypothetical protein